MSETANHLLKSKSARTDSPKNSLESLDRHNQHSDLESITAFGNVT